MACDECRDLNAHDFRTPDDLIAAVRGAALEMDRGVLERIGGPLRSDAEDESLASMFASGALPAMLDLRFRCTVCGDAFTLHADTRDGSGGWRREENIVSQN